MADKKNKGLIQRFKGWVKKKKKESQQSARQAYTQKVKSDKVQQKNHAAATSYDKVRSKATPTRTANRPSGNTGGSSSANRSTGGQRRGWGAVTKATTSPQNRPQAAQTKKTGGWSAYVAKTIKTKAKALGGQPKTAGGSINWSKINSKRYKGTATGDLRKAYEKGKNINALGSTVKTRTGGGVKSKDPTMNDFLKYQYASRNKNLKLDDKTAYKMGSRTAYAANRNSIARASHGFMQGMAPADVESGPEKYNKAAKKALKQSRESVAGNIGYGVGQMAGFAIGRTNSAAKSLVSGGVKAGAKVAAKKGTQTAAKKFVKNRAAEMAVEAPMNAADALKMSKDENGRYNAKKAAGYMALNTGLTGGTGALMEGAAYKFTKKNANQLIHLQQKANKGSITKEEGQKLKNLYDKLNKVREDTARADSGIAAEGYRKGKNAEMEGMLSRINTQDAQNRMRNAKMDKYVRDVNAKNSQFVQERDLIARNKEFIEDGGTTFKDAREQKVPDTTKVPEGMKVNGNVSKSSKKTIRETLGGKHTPEAKAEIHDSVDKMSNMINHGDFEGARIEARKLVEKHGKIEPEIREINHFRRQELKNAQDLIKSTLLRPSDNVLKEVNSKGRIKDLKEAIGDYDWRKVHIQKNRQTRVGQTDIDAVWDDWSDTLPEYFPKDMTDETERYRRIVEISEMKPQHVDDVLRLPDDAIDEAYESMVRDVYDEAEKNAASYKELSKTPKKAEVPKKAKAVPEAKAEEKPASPSEKVAAIKTFSDTDKMFKKSAQALVSKAPHKAEDVGKLVDDYKKAGDAIAANKKKIKNSNTPKHIEEYKDNIEKLEGKQKELNRQIKDLEDTHISQYDNGKEVLSSIDPTETKTAKKAKNNGFWGKVDTFRRLIENSLNEFEKAAKQTGDKKLLNAVNNVIYARNKAGSWIESGRSSFTERNPSGKSLNDIFKDAGAFKDRDVRADFNQYALLRHHIDRANKGKPVFLKDGKTLSIPDAKKAMEALESKYDAKFGTGEGIKKLEQFSDDLTAYSNDLLKYRYDAGLITKEVYEQTLKDYPHYVPTYRIKDGDAGFIYEDANGASIDAVLKAAKGGDAPIEDLYSQLYKITNDVITNAEQNEMIKLYAKDMGFDPKSLSKDVDFEDLEKSRIKVDKNGTISYFVDGKRTTFVANDQAVKGLREWNGNDYAVYCNACAKLGKITGMRIFKGLITDWNIAFGMRNGARDYQQALVNSKNTRWFFRSHPAAIHAIAHKDNAYRKLYEANGGKYYVPSGDPRTVKDPTKTSTFEKIVAPIEAFNGAIEIFPRMSEFIGTINKEADAILKKQNKTLDDLRKEAEAFVDKNPPKNEADKAGAIENKYAELVCNVVGKDTVDEAMRNAADITLNFSRHGVFVKGLNSGVVPYLNPSVQGLSKTIRLFTEGKADKALFSIAAKLSLLTVTPAMANEYFMKDNRDFQDLNTRDKDTQFFIPIGDGKFIKIPKPRENAVLAEPFTYGLRYFFDKAQIGSIKPGEYSSPDNWKQMFTTAKDNIGPVNPLTSNYFSPLLNTALNKTWYGGNIESVSDQKLPVTDRKDETTSAIAIMLADKNALGRFTETNFGKNNPLGKFIASNLSPKKIDNLMDSYFGLVYDVYIKNTAASRNLGEHKYAPSKENIGGYFVNQFILDGVYSNKLAQGFYTKLDKLNKGAKEGQDSYKGAVFMQEYGYSAMDYSSARAAIFGEDKDFAKLTVKEKQEFTRNLKKNQNNVYRDGMFGEHGTFGSFDDNFKDDPLRVMVRELKKTGFEKKTGKMAEGKVLRAFTYTNEEGKNQFADALDKYKDSDSYKAEGKEKGIKKFFNDTIRLRGLLGEAGGSRGFPTWTGASLIAEERSRKSGESHHDFARAYGATDEKLEEAKNYFDYKYNLKNYAHTHKTLERMALRDSKFLNDMDDNKKSVALANKKYSDGSFYIEGEYVDKKCNYARCIASDGVTSKEYNKWMDDNGLRSYSKKKQKGLQRLETRNGSVYYKSSEEDVINAIEKDYGDRSNEFKAAMYRMFYDRGENPYGEVGDYSQDNDRGLHHEDRGYGGYRRHRRRRRGYRRHRRRGGYGGGGRGGSGGAAGQDWNTYVSGIFASAPASSSNKGSVSKTSKIAGQKIHDYTKDSELTEAYRRRAQKKQVIYKS